MRDQAKITEANDKINAARDELEKARKKFDRVYRAQQKIIEAEYAKDEMTLAFALETFLEGGMENVAGYKWLEDRIWKGDWKGKGIMTSGYWVPTKQRVIQVAIPASASDAKLDELEQLLSDEVIPILKQGALSHAPRLNTDYGDAKIIDVFEDDLGETRDYKIAIRPDGEVHVVNTRWYYRNDDGSVIYKGDLRGALTVIRNNLPYGE